jgi:hypothetical protein
LDPETAGKLGVGSESIGGKFKGAGHEDGAGDKESGHEIQKGKPVAADKQSGKGILPNLVGDLASALYLRTLGV